MQSQTNMLLHMSGKEQFFRSKNKQVIPDFMKCISPDRTEKKANFFSRYYNCSFSNRSTFSPDATPEKSLKIQACFRGYEGMKKHISTDVKSSKQENFVTSIYRGDLQEMQDRSDCRSRRIIAHTWALKNEICIFAEILFAELISTMQMTVFPVIAIHERTTRCNFKESDRVNCYHDLSLL